MKLPVPLLPFVLSLGIHAGFLAYGFPGGDARQPLDNGKAVMTLHIRQAKRGPAAGPSPGKDRVKQLQPAASLSRPAGPPPPATPKRRTGRRRKEALNPADASPAVAQSYRIQPAHELNEPESKDFEAATAAATVAAGPAGAPEDEWDQSDNPEDPSQPMASAGSLPVAGEAARNDDAFVSASTLSLVRPAYPHRSRLQGQEGSVTLSVDILPDGRPGNILVIQTSGHRLLDRAAMQALAESRFAPARLGDSPVKTRKHIKFTFGLKGPSR